MWKLMYAMNTCVKNKANLRDLIAATGLLILAQIWSRSSIFQPVWPWNLMDDLKNNRAPFLSYIKLCASFLIHLWIQTKVTVRKRSIRVKIGDFVVPYDFEIWRMTLENYRAPLLCCFKLCAPFHSHHYFQTRVTVRKRPIWVKIDVFLFLFYFLSRVTLKFDR